jgi:hypothetical protein
VDAHPLLRRTCPADQDEEALGRGLLGSTRLYSVDSRVLDHTMSWPYERNNLIILYIALLAFQQSM